MPYSRLKRFYETAPIVFRENHHASKIDGLLNRLSNVILSRESTNEVLLQIISLENSGKNKEELLEEFSETVNKLIMEAAEFHVLSKNIRAIQK